jgi:hypothetical protein
MATSVANERAAEVNAELAKLDARERAISQRRRELHVQIDLLYLAAPLQQTDVARLERLETAEREISAAPAPPRRDRGDARPSRRPAVADIS